MLWKFKWPRLNKLWTPVLLVMPVHFATFASFEGRNLPCKENLLLSGFHKNHSGFHFLIPSWWMRHWRNNCRWAGYWEKSPFTPAHLPAHWYQRVEGKRPLWVFTGPIWINCLLSGGHFWVLLFQVQQCYPITNLSRAASVPCFTCTAPSRLSVVIARRNRKSLIRITIFVLLLLLLPIQHALFCLVYLMACDMLGCFLRDPTLKESNDRKEQRVWNK